MRKNAVKASPRLHFNFGKEPKTGNECKTLKTK